MLIVSTDEAKAGMKLAAPVTHPENPGQDLLRAGFVLEDVIIARMLDMGVQYLYIDYPELEILDKHLAVYLTPARQEILKQITGSMQAQQKQTHAGLPYKDYCSTTRELIETLMTQGQNPIYMDQMSRQGADAVAHAAAVSHLALLMGLKLETYIIDQRPRLPPNRAKDIVNLGVAGMLHDLGLTHLPEHMRKFSETEPPEDEEALKEWRTHSEIGYDKIRNDVEATAAAAVYQHHQHFDGSGFPRLRGHGGTSKGTMEGERIHVFSRILLCANLFDRLTAPVGRKQRRSNLEAHRLIQERFAGWCDPNIVRVLMAVAPPYPPGTRLELSDSTRVIVVDADAAQPYRPRVRRLAADGWTLEGDVIDLRAPGAPTITEKSMAA